MSYTAKQMADLMAIEDAARRYCRGVDRLDAELMRSAYWEDATDDHGPFKGNAWDFVDYVMETHERWRATMHFISNHTVDLEPGGYAATGEVYNVTNMFRETSGGPVVDTWYGRYLDRYEKRGSDWRILHRVCVHEATTTTSIERTMPLDTELFRSGSFDRPAGGQPLGP